MLTAGIEALPVAVSLKTLERLRTFDDFNKDNDPYGGHDCGRFEIEGTVFLWKIDYYDADMVYGSEDPTDPEKTTRVLTLMLAHEY